MSTKTKRISIVTLLTITLFSLGIAAISLRTFTLLGWLILSFQVELGILLFLLFCLGCILGYVWACNADDDESFIEYSKEAINDFVD